MRRFSISLLIAISLLTLASCDNSVILADTDNTEGYIGTVDDSMNDNTIRARLS